MRLSIRKLEYVKQNIKNSDCLRTSLLERAKEILQIKFDLVQLIATHQILTVDFEVIAESREVNYDDRIFLMFAKGYVQNDSENNNKRIILPSIFCDCFNDIDCFVTIFDFSRTVTV